MRKIVLTSFMLLSLGLTGVRGADVYTIYPIPQQQTQGTGTTSFTKDVTIVADSIIDNATLERARQVLAEAGLTGTVASQPSTTGSNIWIGVGGKGIAGRKATSLNVDTTVLGTAGKYDRHLLHLYNDGGRAQVVIVGESVNAAFYALASLEQMLEKGTTDMAAVTIDDYADQQIRGLVEGYYGYPYSVDVKKSLMRFMMRMKMNTYMYGAKSDYYHSAEWESPYPTTLTPEQVHNGLLSQDMIRDLSKESAETKVNFIWAIHPGNAIMNDDNVADRIMNKYKSMYSLGVRQFAVFADDVGVPTTDEKCKANADHITALQNAIDSTWNKPGTRAEDQVKPLHFVPQVYTLSWVSKENRQRFYSALSKIPNKITVYITGNGVWTVPNSGDLKTARDEFGRDLAWWWNYPCNDNADGQIFPSDMYRNFFEMPQVDGNAKMPADLQNGLGIVSNPMQEGMVSRQALFSVADYAWNNSSFDNKKSWEASFSMTFDNTEKADAYKNLAPYLCWNDPDDMNPAINNFKQAGSDGSQLKTILEGIKKNIDVVQTFKNDGNADDSLLYKDLSPWVNKLESMVNIGIGMTAIKGRGVSDAQKWSTYAKWLPAMDNLETDTTYTAYALEGMGRGISVSARQSQPCNKFFYPFMSYLRSSTIPSSTFGASPSTAAAVKISVPNVAAAVSTNNAAGTVSLNTPSPVSLAAGGYVGVTLTNAARLSGVSIADTLLAGYNVSYSSDGQKWTRLTSNAAPAAYVKHIVIRNDGTTARTLRLSAANFTLNMATSEAISAATLTTDNAGRQSSGNKGKSFIYDNDPTTYFTPRHDQAVGDTYTFTLAKATTVKDVRLYFGTTNGDYLEKGKMLVSADNSNWTELNVKGSTAKEGGYAESTNYAENINYIDFTGDVPNAKYIRLQVTKIPGKKWLELNDLQVNVLSRFAPVVTDAMGFAVSGADDKKAYTRVSSAMGGIYYHFQNINVPTSVSIYWTPEDYKGGAAPKIEVTTDGQKWTEVGSLTDDLTTVDLTPYKNIQQLAITTADGTVAPVCEIVENSSEEAYPIPNGIKVLQVSAGGSAKARTADVYTLQGVLVARNLSYDAVSRLPRGIYLVGGRKVVVK